MLIEKLTHKNNKIILHNDHHSYTFMPSLYHSTHLISWWLS